MILASCDFVFRSRLLATPFFPLCLFVSMPSAKKMRRELETTICTENNFLFYYALAHLKIKNVWLELWCSLKAHYWKTRQKISSSRVAFSSIYLFKWKKSKNCFKFPFITNEGISSEGARARIALAVGQRSNYNFFFLPTNYFLSQILDKVP